VPSLEKQIGVYEQQTQCAAFKTPFIVAVIYWRAGDVLLSKCTQTNQMY
jgi:hypothetical protein